MTISFSFLPNISAKYCRNIETGQISYILIVPLINFGNVLLLLLVLLFGLYSYFISNSLFLTRYL